MFPLEDWVPISLGTHQVGTEKKPSPAGRRGGETLFPLIRAPGVPEDREPPLPPAVTGRPREHLDFKARRETNMSDN